MIGKEADRNFGCSWAFAIIVVMLFGRLIFHLDINLLAFYCNCCALGAFIAYLIWKIAQP